MKEISEKKSRQTFLETSGALFGFISEETLGRISTETLG